jgi:hypothetical protein
MRAEDTARGWAAVILAVALGLAGAARAGDGAEDGGATPGGGDAGGATMGDEDADPAPGAGEQPLLGAIGGEVPTGLFADPFTDTLSGTIEAIPWGTTSTALREAIPGGRWAGGATVPFDIEVGETGAWLTSFPTAPPLDVAWVFGERGLVRVLCVVDGDDAIGRLREFGLARWGEPSFADASGSRLQWGAMRIAARDFAGFAILELRAPESSGVVIEYAEPPQDEGREVRDARAERAAKAQRREIRMLKLHGHLRLGIGGAFLGVSGAFVALGASTLGVSAEFGGGLEALAVPLLVVGGGFGGASVPLFAIGADKLSRAKRLSDRERRRFLDFALVPR